jgi:hypothetical protein
MCRCGQAGFATHAVLPRPTPPEVKDEIPTLLGIVEQDPAVFGPLVWDAMHTKAAEYSIGPTLKDRDETFVWFQRVLAELPCEECREHIAGLVRRFPIWRALVNRDTLESWVLHLHNHVNAKLGRPTWATPRSGPASCRGVGLKTSV